MLILTRKLSESFRIGNDVSVFILDTTDKHVKLAIKAPREISVHRDEVYRRIQDEKRLAEEAAV